MNYATKTALGQQFHCESEHRATGKTFTTEVPYNIGGTGQSFAPIEALGAVLCSCMLSMLNYAAKGKNIDVSDSYAIIEPIEANGKVAEFIIKITVTKPVPAEERPRLERAAEHCPVKNSLNPDIKYTITWDWQ